MTVLNVDASRDKKSFVKDVILGVGLIDPLDCHIRMGEESGSQILVMIVLDEGIGKGACDDLVDHSLEEGNLAREERFAIHLDDLAHDRSDILDDVNLHAALGSGENGLTHAGAGLVRAPDVHEDLHAFPGFFQLRHHEVKGGFGHPLRRKGSGQGRVEQMIALAHVCRSLSEQE